MSLGYLKIPFESVVLRYDDELTPVKLTGKKMLPIFEFNNNKIMNESLDIISELDTKNLLKKEKYQENKVSIDSLLREIGDDVHSLCMPYWIWTPEFDADSRNYFQKKKEVKRGPFKNLIKSKDSTLTHLNKILIKLEDNLDPYYQSSQISILDIMIASHVWGLYIFPEFQFSSKLHNYLQLIKKECAFDYHQDYWK